MTLYVQVQTTSEPYDMGLDEQGRLRYGFELVTFQRPSTDVLRELILILEDAGVGTFGVNLFATEAARGAGTFVKLIANGGLPNVNTSDARPAYVRVGVRAVVTGTSLPVVKAKAWEVFNAFEVRNLNT